MIKQVAVFLIKATAVAAFGAAAVFSPYALFVAAFFSGMLFMVSAYTDSKPRSLALVLISLIATVAASFSYGINISTVSLAISTFLLTCAGGFAIGYAAKHNFSFMALISSGAACYLAPILIWFVKYKFFDHIDILEQYVNRPVAEFFAMYNEMMSAANIENAEAIIKLTGDLQWYMQQAVAMVLPSFFIILCALLSYLVFLLGRKLLFKAHSIALEGYPAFWQIQLSRSVSFVLAGLFIISFFMDTSAASGAVTNIIIILCALYMQCGISVVDSFFRKTRIPSVLRLIIYGVALLTSGVIGMLIPFVNIPALILFAGVTDSMFDFRHLREGDRQNER